MDGHQVVQTLKADPALRSLPVIAVTALAMVGDRERLLASGFDGYIAKPIDPQRFVDEIAAFLPASTRQ
jgi:CheY-like chemotaxis protein